MADRFRMHDLALPDRQRWQRAEEALTALETRTTAEEALGDRLAVYASADTAITTTSATAITGATDSVTPAVDCRATITGTFAVTATLFASAAAGFLIGELTVNGATQTPVCWNQPMGAGARFTISQTWTVNLTAGVTYTFALTARVNAAVGNTFAVRQSHSGIQVRLGRRL